ncbi:hypothetical protein LOTGIDRAFT_164336 [Lottia gigantea]|uniref:Uncharacterized protein n=1 Tax=Lottia gigantea TaxID=225164 RepID=V4A4W5_LOTGI|nr:hypothetical protein LOTGIDRAFT_164336 [Lottia gigantea]ESO90035.1 hypothetical protein LOTGIDRAFT_164336 [Lottia gigantea]
MKKYESSGVEHTDNMKIAIIPLVLSLLLINVDAQYRRSLIRHLTPNIHPLLAQMVNPGVRPRICYIQRVPVYIPVPVPVRSMAPVRRTSQTIVSRGRFMDRLPKLAARKNSQPKVEQKNPVQPNIYTMTTPPTYIKRIEQKKVEDNDEDVEAAKESKLTDKITEKMVVYGGIFDDDDDDPSNSNYKQEMKKYVKNLNYINDNAKEFGGYEMVPVGKNINYDIGKDKSRGDSAGYNPVPQKSYRIINVLPNANTQRVLSSIISVNDNDFNEQSLNDDENSDDDSNAGVIINRSQNDLIGKVTVDNSNTSASYDSIDEHSNAGDKSDGDSADGDSSNKDSGSDESDDDDSADEDSGDLENAPIDIDSGVDDSIDEDSGTDNSADDENTDVDSGTDFDSDSADEDSGSNESAEEDRFNDEHRAANDSAANESTDIDRDTGDSAEDTTSDDNTQDFDDEPNQMDDTATFNRMMSTWVNSNYDSKFGNRESNELSDSIEAYEGDSNPSNLVSKTNYIDDDKINRLYTAYPPVYTKLENIPDSLSRVGISMLGGNPDIDKSEIILIPRNSGPVFTTKNKNINLMQTFDQESVNNDIGNDKKVKAVNSANENDDDNVENGVDKSNSVENRGDKSKSLENGAVRSDSAEEGDDKSYSIERGGYKSDVVEKGDYKSDSEENEDRIGRVEEDVGKSDSVEKDDDKNYSVEEDGDKSDSGEEDDDKNDRVEEDDFKSDRVGKGNDKNGSLEEEDDKSNSIEKDGDKSVQKDEYNSDSLKEGDNKSDNEENEDRIDSAGQGGDKSDSLDEDDYKSDSGESGDDKSDSVESGDDKKSGSVEEDGDKSDSVAEGDNKSDSTEKGNYENDSVKEGVDINNSVEEGENEKNRTLHGREYNRIVPTYISKTDSDNGPGVDIDNEMISNWLLEHLQPKDNYPGDAGVHNRLINILKPISVNNNINSNQYNIDNDDIDTDDVEIRTFKRPLINILGLQRYRGIVLGNNQNNQIAGERENGKSFENNGTFGDSEKGNTRRDNEQGDDSRDNVTGKRDNAVLGDTSESIRSKGKDNSRDNVSSEKLKVKYYQRNTSKGNDERDDFTNDDSKVETDAQDTGNKQVEDNGYTANSKDNVKIDNSMDDMNDNVKSNARSYSSNDTVKSNRTLNSKENKVTGGNRLPKQYVDSKDLPIQLTRSQFEELMKKFNAMNTKRNTIPRRKQVDMEENERVDEMNYSENNYLGNNFHRYSNLFNEEGFEFDLSYDQRKPDKKVNNTGPSRGLKSSPTAFMDIKNKNMKTIGISYILPHDHSTNSNTNELYDMTVKSRAKDMNVTKKKKNFLNVAKLRSKLYTSTAPTVVEIPEVKPTQLIYRTTSAINVLPSVPTTRMVRYSTDHNTHLGVRSKIDGRYLQYSG